MLNKKSEANLEIAVVCLDKNDEKFFSVGASRAYYAIFQATKYLLVKKSFDYKKFKKNVPIAKKQRDYSHGSIGAALEYFLLNNGFNSQDDLIFIKEMHSTFIKLYDWRRQADYEKAVITKRNLEEAIEKAEMFINKLKKYN
ncbi:MAG: HEPN domain-containing protein [Leptospirales bacterium]|nr:HEPN domain-containing protein [Leptospirales bacterium]